MFFQKGSSVLSKKCVCSVKEACLLFQKGLSVLLKRVVCSFKKVGMSVLSKKCFCSVKEVCLFSQKVLSALSDRYICSFRKVCLFCQRSVPLFFVLYSYLGTSHHQADACHMASVYLGFCSIWNTYFCLRLQPHLYPVPVVTSFGRSDGTRQRYKSTHVEPDALVRTRNYF